MNIKKFVDKIDNGFFSGVPDSQLKELCNYLLDTYGISRHHMIAANEGNSTALAAGYFLATGKVPVVYMQNSGIGNAVNPIVSLLNNKVYGIPCIFVVGWRGEPGMKDEPQHNYQGRITLQLLHDLNIKTFILDKNTIEEELDEWLQKMQPTLRSGESIAFVVKKDAFQYESRQARSNGNVIVREEAIRRIVNCAKEDVIVSTTGKASRELFEIREKNGQSHQYDFLTVGSMGHSSSIALSIALSKPQKRIWCIDGDGAALMHMGAMAVIGSMHPSNLIHIVLNNGVHDTVGGMPTVASDIDFVTIAAGCGYQYGKMVRSYHELDAEITTAKKRNQLTFIEVSCAEGARTDLGRPTTSTEENKDIFMAFLQK